MKRLLCLMLAVLFLGGCASKADEGGIFFVYPKKDYIYSVSEGSVAREKRDVTDRELGYLLRLYLLGPQDEELEAVIAEYAENSGMPAEDFKKQISDDDREYLTDRKVAEKTVELIVSSVQLVTEKKKPEPEKTEE